MIAWSIWEARNDLLHNSHQRALKDILYSATSILNEFLKANILCRNVNSEVQNDQWFPPQVGLAKVNFDVVVFYDLNVVRIGVAIRDAKGEVLALLSCLKHVPTDPYIVECVALKEAISFALEIGIERLLSRETPC
ncbi:hypothetical protein REPUB_Repub02eG0193000 [Reevesia pubescens]